MVNAPLNPAPPKLTLLPLVMVLFFTVSGGAYGLEDLVSASGPGMALLLIIITPIIWSLPVALMVSELAAAMPAEGGYYVWVKQAISPFWGFQAGWWSWLMSITDMAVYPVLFADYTSTLLLQYFDSHVLANSKPAHWLTTLLLIWPLTYLNIRGVKAVGDFSRFFGIMVLAPFLVMAVIGGYHWLAHPLPVWQPFVPPDTGIAGAFGVGLFVVMWNYMGWDIIANIAGEIDNPRRNLPLAMAIAIPLITLAYLLPTFAGLTASDWQHWTAGAFPKIAAAVGGPWLGGWLGVAALLSTAGLFNALLLSFSRIPFVIAADGYLPAALTRLHPTYQTPYVAIIVCSAIYSLFTFSTFTSLVVLDVVLYSAVIFLEFAALIRLRLTRPDMLRPYHIPGGWWGIVLITLLPVALLILALVSTLQELGLTAVLWSAIALASGPLAYGICSIGKRKADTAISG